jgi:NhaA family Na+:H+ antiporter
METKKTIMEKALNPLNRFMHFEHSEGLVLLLSVISALVLANSPFRDSYHHFWETKLRIAFLDRELNYSLHQWVNDGLMAMFFFVVGLELKRELIIGELSSFKKAILPIAAAVGGMVLPAVFYIFINYDLNSENGWGIPMATDIVFTLALMGLVSKKIPLAAKIFLVALATVDDLGAVLVIALFYSSEISAMNLILGFCLLAVLALANLVKVRNVYFYAIVGIGGVWLAFLLSGVHATIAGVLVAFTIPAKTRINENLYSGGIRKLLGEYDKEIPEDGPLITSKQHYLIEEIKNLSLKAQSPLQKLEIKLHPWTSYLIIPLFALSNAGVAIEDSFFEDLFNPVTMGIILGLIGGKFVGILLFTWILVKTKIAPLPKFSSWKHIVGLALLAGVGFTMSLFITNLAFIKTQHIDQAKIGILIASVISGTLGILVLKSLKDSDENSS